MTHLNPNKMELQQALETIFNTLPHSFGHDGEHELEVSTYSNLTIAIKYYNIYYDDFIFITDDKNRDIIDYSNLSIKEFTDKIILMFNHTIIKENINLNPVDLHMSI